jgi:hypothetical protein
VLKWRSLTTHKASICRTNQFKNLFQNIALASIRIMFANNARVVFIHYPNHDKKLKNLSYKVLF